MFLTNKHVIIALIVAPILAIIAYFAVDHTVSEAPKNAVAGTHYPLVAKSNCRYKSGKCTFKNGDIEIELISDESDPSLVSFTLNSDLPLQGVKLALTENTKQASPIEMQTANYQQTEWQVSLDNNTTDTTRLLLVVALNDSLYFGETEATFIHYETSFPRDNIR